MRAKRAIALFALMVAGCTLPVGSAQAADAAAWNLKQLMQGLGQVKTAKGRFVERKYLSVLSEPLESSGTLVYTAPDKLEKNTLLPKPESLLVDQEKLTFDRGAGQQRRTLVLQDYPEIWAFVESIRATLAGDLSTLNRFYIVSLEGDVADWQLLLQPNEQKMQAIVRSIRIRGSADWVNSIEIQEADGDRSVMTVARDE
jgi:outer membrane lipoprotein-sorting protein